MRRGRGRPAHQQRPGGLAHVGLLIDHVALFDALIGGNAAAVDDHWQSALEQAVRPQSGSPPHICHGADKTIYVIEGEFAILAGERTVRAARGDMVFLPAGTPHNFRNVGAAEGRIMWAPRRGGFW